MNLKANRRLARQETPLRAGRKGGPHTTKKGARGYSRARDRREMQRWLGA